MRGIASQVIVSSLLSSEPKVGELSETTLFSFASVWIFASWDCRRLHTGNTPISSAIRMTSTTSTLTRMYRCHPCPSTLVITRKVDRMFLFNRNKLCHWLIKNLATWATWKCGIYWRSWNDDGNICWMLRRSLLRHTWLSISFKVQCVVRRRIGILKLGFGSTSLKGMTSVFLPLERSEPTTWEVTSAWVQKHNLSTMLSKQAANDSFSNSKALTLNSNRSIRSFNASISAHCLLTRQKNLSCSLLTYVSLARLLSAMASAYALTLARSFFIWFCSRSRWSP